MNDPLRLMLSGVAGGLLGAIFFGGLLWTVRKGLASRQPALWFLGSLLLRMSIALGGIRFVWGGHWTRLMSCLVGFVVARLVVSWLARNTRENSIHSEREASHAPGS